jgi:pyruvate-formate lyase-activating enzyme
MLDQLQGLHIEPTNMCTLKCPRCSRTEFIEQFPKQWTNKNLNLDHLKSFLDIDLTDKKINLCGNYGDAIYYDRLFDMIEYFKSSGSHITLSTNGSYKTQEWWAELGHLLDENDEVIFAIDGLPTTFTNYRINADWNSIEAGIKILRNKPIKLVWQFIPFSFNENEIDQTRELSQELGFDNFFVLNSDRWDHGAEKLIPTSINNINIIKINWKSESELSDEILARWDDIKGSSWPEKPKKTDKIPKWIIDESINMFNINVIDNSNKEIAITPECKVTNKSHYISADGFYTPCCWTAEHRWYYKTKFFKNRELYDISKTTITRVLDHLKDFYSTLEDAKLNYCTFNCPKL